MCDVHTLKAYSIIPIRFEVLLWLNYALNIIPNSDFETTFLPIISFINFFVAENVAKLVAG